jgi:hypothetical protein
MAVCLTIGITLNLCVAELHNIHGGLSKQFRLLLYNFLFSKKGITQCSS